MAAQLYPLGTFPKQFFGGGIARSMITPNAGGPGGGFKAGGSVLGTGPLQNNNIFDSTFGSLGYPYLGQHNQYNDNKPVQQVNPGMGLGITTAVSNGTFAVMTRGQYVMLTFNSQLAGVATTVLRSPGSSYHKSENSFIGWINSTVYWKNNAGGFYLYNGLPVKPNVSRDQVNTETISTYANPSKLTFNSTGKLASVTSYHAKSD